MKKGAQHWKYVAILG